MRAWGAWELIGQDKRGRVYFRHRYMACEHCDRPWEDGHMIRLDSLRGYTCRDCDSALDEMLQERNA